VDGIGWASYLALELLVCRSASVRPFDFLNPLGNVYSGWDIKTRQELALKLELIKTRNPRLSNEYTVYRALSNAPGFPAMHWYGTEALYNVLILDRLNLTLEEAMFKSHDSSVFSFADQMVFPYLFRYGLNYLIHIPLTYLFTAFTS
jgi:hypothetical protein